MKLLITLSRACNILITKQLKNDTSRAARAPARLFWIGQILLAANPFIST
jgi:hypothetical protein